MDETIIVPSPNWFHVSVVAASSDGWLVYGGPSKCLCVLEPLSSEYKGVIDGDQRFKAHVVKRAHNEKIVSVDINPEWPQKRNFLTGSADGTVKEWCLEMVDNMWSIKYIHGHEAHYHEKEEVAGVGYSTANVAITVGSFGNIVKWDLNTNAIKVFTSFLKNFKPTCMSCSPHIPMQVAVGTKQGVVALVDLSGSGKLLYKVRGQDAEVVQLGWCPQYEVMVKKTLEESKKRWSAMERMEKIRNEPEPCELATEKLDTPESEKSVTENESQISVAEDLASAIDKKLPEDSFDTSIVQEDDMFDIYKDHEADEFGHKKYQPEDIYVKIKKDSKQDDFLAECEKLKAEILKKKNEPEESMESLVNAMDKVKVDGNEASGSSKEILTETSSHIHKHLLASIGKFGGVRIWSKTGKLVATCAVQAGAGKNQKIKAPNWPTLCWHTTNSLLIADGKSQLLLCNPLVIDCKNKLEWRVLHSHHRRGLYCIVSEAPRVQTSPSKRYNVWTAAQDRLLVRYCPYNNTTLIKITTAGGFIYDVKQCPYDANKIAICVGDGALRVWEMESTDDEGRISIGTVTTYWQNVQGKVLTAAWHPTRENLLAFSTAESRVGLLDTSNKCDRPAKVLQCGTSGGVYSLCWGERMELYAVAGGNLLLYQADKIEKAPTLIPITVECEPWAVSSLNYSTRGLVASSTHGGVALLDPHTRETMAAKFVYSNTIHMTEWHPQYTSSSQDESPYQNLLAVCAIDKLNNVIVLELKEKEGGGVEWSIFATLSGHSALVFKVSWSEHSDGTLFTFSKDNHTRIWQVSSGTCTHIFDCGAIALCGGALSLAPDAAISAGTDFSLRLWLLDQHTADKYTEKEAPKKKRKEPKKEPKKEIKEEAVEVVENAAVTSDFKTKASKKFMFPILLKQCNQKQMNGGLAVIKKYLEENGRMEKLCEVIKGNISHEYDTDYLKIFGSINDVNDALDMEMANHLEAKNFEAYMMMLIFRGDIHSMIQFASQRDMLDPFLLSITPCVSFKYWKDAMQLYLTQIDRLAAKGEAEKLNGCRSYGGYVRRKVASLLAVHDVTTAVNVLCDGKLYMEAYVLCRLRHMDSIAEETLHKWAEKTNIAGNYMLSAICQIALGNLSQAAITLGRSNEQEHLNLAAELAKTVGHNTFANHVEQKAKEKTVTATTEEILEELPKRIELLLREKEISKENNSDSANVETVNGSKD